MTPALLQTLANHVIFQAADLQTAQPDSRPFTAATSQFGVMFLDQPEAASANI